MGPHINIWNVTSDIKGPAPRILKRETDTRVTCTVDVLKHLETLCAITMRYMLRMERTNLGNYQRLISREKEKLFTSEKESKLTNALYVPEIRMNLEVILNGNKVLKRTVGEVKHEYEPTSAEEKQDRRNEMKARGTLLMALPNKDQLKFHSYKDAKLLMEATEKSSEIMDQTFDTLQKLISQLEIQGEVISQEDMNLKPLRSLPSEWKTHALIWRNKEEIETISLDDFTRSNSNSSINEADNTAYRVSAAHTQSNPTSRDSLSDAVICAFLASQPNSHQLAREDLE
ncbi:hypothetical protein Tco_0884762 [Tanacetum coccineum]